MTDKPARERNIFGPRKIDLVKGARPLDIASALNGSANSLGLIRLALAALVIVSHTYPLGGFGTEFFQPLTRGQVGLGGIAVAGFFAISGYLITKSGYTSDVVQFMWRRVIRIFPAYWLVLIVTAGIVGPVVWLTAGNSWDSYIHGSGLTPLHYLGANWSLKIGAFGIYDIFVQSTPYGDFSGISIMNGALWTLFYEWECYLLIGVLVLFGVLRRARVLVPVMAAFSLALIIAEEFGALPVNLAPLFLRNHDALNLTFIFLIGATFAMYSKRIPYSGPLAGFAGIVLLVSLRWGGYSTIGIIAGAYLLLFLSAWLPQSLHWIGAKNDYSYGLYIYGFLVQQTLANFGVNKLGFLPYLGLSLLIAFVCAWLSWHLVEKRALGLKSWGPGRGAAFWWGKIVARRARPE